MPQGCGNFSSQHISTYFVSPWEKVKLATPKIVCLVDHFISLVYMHILHGTHKLATRLCGTISGWNIWAYSSIELIIHPQTRKAGSPDGISSRLEKWKSTSVGLVVKTLSWKDYRLMALTSDEYPGGGSPCSNSLLGEPISDPSVYIKIKAIWKHSIY